MKEKGVPSVAHLADLARLDLRADERARYEKEFRDIVAFVGRIASVEARDLPVTATISGVRQVLREDRAAPSDLSDALLACAPDRRGRFIRVPKIL